MDVHADVDTAPETFFRPVKKRKFLRRRLDPEVEDSEVKVHSTNEEDACDSYSSDPHVLHDTNDVTRSTPAIHFRRPHRTRRGGIEFSSSSRQLPDNGRQVAPVEPATEDLEGERIRAMCDRFTGHTGQTVDADKHMYCPSLPLVYHVHRVMEANKIRMTYIESEMAKRYRRLPTDLPNSDASYSNAPAGGQCVSDIPRREPASLGKLHEIDLGQETKLQNIARTEAATKNLTDHELVSTEKEATPKRDPPEKDEKPWRSRKRRNSEDIERDRLVEEVLRESKRKHSPNLLNPFPLFVTPASSMHHH